MIHHHGTPITPIEQLMRMAGRHFCVSFADPRDLERVLAIGQSVMLDNGAWSAHTRGEAFDLDGYYRWLDPVLANPHWAVIPDVIDGSELQNDDLLRQWPRGEFGDLGAPVWHLHESIDRLERLADAWPRICLGSSGAYRTIGTDAWNRRMDEAFNCLARSRVRLPWVHGMRMLGQADGDWPLASADSSNVAQSWFHRNTRDTPATGCAECMAKGIDGYQAPTRWKQRPTQRDLL